MHIGGNDDVPPYACGICKSRFFLPRSLLVHIEHVDNRKTSSSEDESDEPQLGKMKPLKPRNQIPSDSEDDDCQGEDSSRNREESDDENSGNGEGSKNEEEGGGGEGSGNGEGSGSGEDGSGNGEGRW